MIHVKTNKNNFKKYQNTRMKHALVIFFFGIIAFSCKKTSDPSPALLSSIIADSLGNGIIRIVFDNTVFDNSSIKCSYTVTSKETTSFSANNVEVKDFTITLPVKTRYYALKNLSVWNAGERYECTTGIDSSFAVYNRQTVTLRPRLVKIIIPDTLFITAYSQNQSGQFYDIATDISVSSNNGFSFMGNLVTGVNALAITKPSDSITISLFRTGYKSIAFHLSMTDIVMFRRVYPFDVFMKEDK